MPGVGPGVFELRDSDNRSWYRVLYLKKIGNSVYVLHSFEKRTNQTPQKDIDTACIRMKAVQAQIREKSSEGKTRKKK
jgi:phage-related protein